MSDHDLFLQISKVLKTRQVRKLCRGYHVDPDDGLGELFERLSKRSRNELIVNPAIWVYTNGLGVLRNWLLREIRTLV